MRVVATVSSIAIVNVLLLIDLSCASQPAFEPSGFLGDYAGFAPTEHPDRFLDQPPDAGLGRYDKVMIDPVLVFVDPDAAYRGIDPEHLDIVASYFEATMAAAVEDAYPVVDAPGPGVLRVRVAVTDIEPLRTESGAAVRRIRGPITRENEGFYDMPTMFISFGGAAIEAELLDSATGERLQGLIDRQLGARSGVQPGMTPWGQVKRAFDDWAQRLRLRLDEAHQE